MQTSCFPVGRLTTVFFQIKVKAAFFPHGSQETSTKKQPLLKSEVS